MTEFHDVQFERMRPQQVLERRQAADVALLPLGNLEWHGVQNPLGLDALKAHDVCCRAARKMNGGAVFPPVLWGTPRDSFNVGIAGEPVAKIAQALGTEPARWQATGHHGGMDTQEQWLFYQRLLRMVLEHIAGFGFRSIYICSGHGPFTHWIRPVAVAFTRATQMAGAIVTTDWGNVFDAAGLPGDHGGKAETSSMMAIDPALVDLTELDRHPDFLGIGSGRDAPQSTAAFGEEQQEASANGVAAEAKWLADNYPTLPKRHGHGR